MFITGAATFGFYQRQLASSTVSDDKKKLDELNADKQLVSLSGCTDSNGIKGLQVAYGDSISG